MKRTLLLLLAIVIVCSWLLVRPHHPHPAPESPDSEPLPTQPPLPAESPAAPFFARYGQPETPPIDDLKSVRMALTSFHELFKNPDLLPVMSNATITATLTGENLEGLQFIPKGHPAINQKGQLTDRWGTPLQFHPESLKKITLRSAGPDRKLFTTDDLIVKP